MIHYIAYLTINSIEIRSLRGFGAFCFSHRHTDLLYYTCPGVSSIFPYFFPYFSYRKSMFRCPVLIKSNLAWCQFVRNQFVWILSIKKCFNIFLSVLERNILFLENIAFLLFIVFIISKKSFLFGNI